MTDKLKTILILITRAKGNLTINALDSRTNCSSRLKKARVAKKKKKEKNTTIYDKRNAFSLQQKEAVLIAF